MISRNENGKSLSSLLLEAADDPNQWGIALAKIASTCGTIAGIITLRSIKDAKIVISSEIETEYHTPYVGGFPPEMVKIYVDQFRENDPWALVQSHTHPHVPTLMSDHLSISQFGKTEFGKWVSQDFFNDTLVVEIGRSKNYWTALNLYFMHQDATQARQIQSQLNTYLPDIRRAWSVSRKLQQSLVIEQKLLEHVQNHPDAIFLINAENRVQAISCSGARYLEKGIVQICERTKYLKLSSSIHCHANITSHVSVFKDEEGAGEGFIAELDHSFPSTIPTGEKLGLEVISIGTWVEKQVLPWESPILTEREKLQVLIIAKNNSVEASADALNVGERRNRQIWRDVKKKLGGVTKAEIVALYQRQNENHLFNKR